jgi:hypothetical protein
LNAPRASLAPLLPRQEYPGRQARASNELHQVDLVGPIYVMGRNHRYNVWVGKYAFDDAARLGLVVSRRLDEVLWFAGECWKDLGRPEQAQFDNARELSGWGLEASTLSGVIRLCLRFGVSPVFIPAGERQFNGKSTRCSRVRRRRSTAAACGCRSCPRASWWRRGGYSWRWGT